MIYLYHLIILVYGVYGQKDYLNVYCNGPVDVHGMQYTYMIYSLTPTLSQLNILCQTDGSPSHEVNYFLGQCGFVDCTSKSPHLYFINVTALPLQTEIAIAISESTLTYPGNSATPISLIQCFGNNINRLVCLSTINQDSIMCLNDKLNFIPTNQLCISNWSYIIAGAVGLILLCVVGIICLIYRYRDAIMVWCRPDDGYTLLQLVESED